MPEAGPNLFAAWDNFYVIVGGAAAALTGLQFVVMAILADSDRPGGPNEIAAFGTPTVVHFCSALLISGVFSAPWPSVASVGYAITLVGVAGTIYSAIVFMRARRQTGYKPEFSDWLWHTILPAIAYVLVLLGGVFIGEPRGTMAFFIAGAAMLLVFIGIHNAWDTVTYITFVQRSKGSKR